MYYPTASHWLSRFRNRQTLYFSDHYFQTGCQKNCQYLQGKVSGEVGFQVNQTVPENQCLHRNQQEFSNDTDLDCTVCLSTLGPYQVPVETEKEHAANIAPIASNVCLKNVI